MLRNSFIFTPEDNTASHNIEGMSSDQIRFPHYHPSSFSPPYNRQSQKPNKKITQSQDLMNTSITEETGDHDESGEIFSSFVLDGTSLSGKNNDSYDNFSNSLENSDPTNFFIPPPTNPFANFDSQLISPISTSFDSKSSKVNNKLHNQYQSFSRPRPLFHNSTTSISSLNQFSHTKTFSSSSSINSSISSNGSSIINFSTSPSINKKMIKYPIPQGVEIITDCEIQSLIDKNNDSNEDISLLIIDVRTYLDFNKEHIKESINFNLPSTLLKRSNYNLKRCLNNITNEEKIKLTDFLTTEVTKTEIVLIYDNYPILNDEITLNLYGIINKFLESDDFNGKVVLLQNGFQSFRDNNPDLITQTITIDSQPRPCLNTRSLSLANLPTTTEFGSPPSLSKFKLPTASSKSTDFTLPISFKIRHNEEILSNIDEKDLLISKEFIILQKYFNNEKLNLPQWLQQSIKTENELFEDFKSLEIQEKDRINSLIRENLLSFGIELGYKNRYKDIFPYESTRIKLSSDSSIEPFYINGNMINSIEMGITLPGTQYISTQAPLISTMNDFIRVITEKQIGLIICLTEQFENILEKCHAYWLDEHYFQCLETLKISKNLILRKLKINKISNQIVWQFQILNWVDFDIINDSSHLLDLISIINLKKNLIEMKLINPLTMIHCSAGCGRTGTFCTLDTIISGEGFTNNIINNNNNNNLVFKLVENFRRQRMSMVQNLRQYLFIYEVLIYYFENKDTDLMQEYINGIYEKIIGLFKI